MLFLASLPLAACGGTDGAGISVSALSGPGSTPTAEDASGTTFTLSEGLLHLRHIELDLPAGTTCADVADALVGATCSDVSTVDDEAKIRIAGPIVVDLVAGTSTPSLDDVVIPAGTYDRIDLRVDDGDPQEGLVEPGSALDDNAFAVIAEFDHDGTPTVLDLRLNFDEDIRIEQPGGVEVAAGDDLAARFATGAWLDGVDLVACIAGGDVVIADGVAVIDDEHDGSCSGIEDTIKRNMKESGDLSSSDD